MKRLLITTAVAATLLAGSAFVIAQPSFPRSAPTNEQVQSRIEARTEQFAQELNLTPAQQAALTVLVRDAQAVREDRRATVDALLTRVDAALAAQNPDLRAISADIETVVDQLLAEFRVLRDARLGFYDQLTSEQQQIVVAKLRLMSERLQAFLEFMEHRAGHRTGAAWLP